MDTLAEYTPGSESLSSLLVFDKKAEKQATARRPVGEGFGLRRLTASADEVDSRTRGLYLRGKKHACLNKGRLDMKVFSHLSDIFLFKNAVVRI